VGDDIPKSEASPDSDAIDAAMTTYVGIDPGLGGGIAVLKDGGKTVSLKKTPVFAALKKKILGGMATKTTQKARYDIYSMVHVAESFARGEAVDLEILIEKQQSLGPAAMGGAYQEFVTGYGYGIWIGILSTLRLPFREISPRDWQATMLAAVEGKDTKEKSRAAAAQIWPAVDFRKSGRARLADHGLTDAVLLAEYGRRLREGL
jgi:hypothetical protein